MIPGSTEALIARLAENAPSVKPLPSPGRRALLTLAVVAAAGLLAIFLSNPRGHLGGTDEGIRLEMMAVLATGLLGVAGAFFAAVPGRSRLWLAAPLPFFGAWLLMSGASCYADLAAGGSERMAMGSSWHCLLFITATSLGLALPVTWLLSRAAPIEAGRVAVLAGLGVATLSTFLLYFFHPFEVTAGDIAVHMGTIALVTGTIALLRRQAFGRV